MLTRTALATLLPLAGEVMVATLSSCKAVVGTLTTRGEALRRLDFTGRPIMLPRQRRPVETVTSKMRVGARSKQYPPFHGGPSALNPSWKVTEPCGVGPLKDRAKNSSGGTPSSTRPGGLSNPNFR